MVLKRVHMSSSFVMAVSLKLYILQKALFNVDSLMPLMELVLVFPNKNSVN